MAKKCHCPFMSADKTIIMHVIWGIVFAALYFNAELLFEGILLNVLKGAFVALAAYFVLTAALLTEELYD